MLAPGNPHNTIPQGEPNASEPFKCLAQRSIEKTLHHRKCFLRAKIPSFGKELPHDVGSIVSPLLSERTIVEYMFHRFTRLWPEWGQLLSIFAEFFLRHSLTSIPLWTTHKRKASSGALVLCHTTLHSREVEGKISINHLYKISSLGNVCLVIHFLPSLAK